MLTYPGLFTSGALFTQDYLADGIRASAQYQAADVKAARAAIEAMGGRWRG